MDNRYNDKDEDILKDQKKKLKNEIHQLKTTLTGLNHNINCLKVDRNNLIEEILQKEHQLNMLGELK